MSPLRIAVTGAAGRMGRAIVTHIMATDGCTLSAATAPPGSSAIGQDAGTLAGLGPIDVLVTEDTKAALEQSDAVIDFTIPEATLAHAQLTAELGIIHIIGTTGLGKAEEAAISQAAQKIAIVKSGNMSLGVNLVAHLTRRAAEILGDDFDIEIVEMHHRNKIDAPSGTALLIGEAAAEGRSIDLNSHSDRARDGHTGARKRGDIGFASLRGGGVVGEHTVMFASDEERIELTHKAQDRGLFAKGAIRAALWAKDKNAGLYSMADVLGL